jgi:hypothetical protein
MKLYHVRPQPVATVLHLSPTAADYSVNLESLTEKFMDYNMQNLISADKIAAKLPETLSGEQKLEFTELLQNYSELFSDKPTVTHLI